MNSLLSGFVVQVMTELHLSAYWPSSLADLIYDESGGVIRIS